MDREKAEGKLKEDFMEYVILVSGLQGRVGNVEAVIRKNYSSLKEQETKAGDNKASGMFGKWRINHPVYAQNEESSMLKGKVKARMDRP